MSANARRAILLGLLIALADWLFVWHRPGLSIAIFLAALAVGTALANPDRLARRQTLMAAALLIAALAPIVESASLLSCLIGTLAAANFALTASERPARDIIRRIVAAFGLIFIGPFHAIFRFAKALERIGRRRQAEGLGGTIILWAVPGILGTAFLGLFSIANPVIGSWLGDINLSGLLALVDTGRIEFWVVMAFVAAPFVFLKAVNAVTPAPVEPGEAAPLPHWLTGEVVVLRSLVLFNTLFAVQSALDIHYLWRGAALPTGMTYADYAHRGAYPLIGAALLAGAFVVVALRPGSASSQAPLIRALVFAWLGQTVLLVLSSLLRLKLYVAAYSLTTLRAAAFLWMMLVAVGLILIAIRILLARSDAWLVSINVAALAITLYLCGFVDFPQTIASYNVTHSGAMMAGGAPLDSEYLGSLGPDAIPAMDLYLAKLGRKAPSWMTCRRAALAMRARKTARDWRAWSFRNWRLVQYLDRNSAPG